MTILVRCRVSPQKKTFKVNITLKLLKINGFRNHSSVHLSLMHL